MVLLCGLVVILLFSGFVVGYLLGCILGMFACVMVFVGFGLVWTAWYVGCCSVVFAACVVCVRVLASFDCGWRDLVFGGLL